jgi:hypothetical protein
VSLRRWVLGFSWGGFFLGWGASFLCLGRLFSWLGWLFSGLGCVGGVCFFCFFASWSVVPLRLVPRSPRLCPWFVLSGGRAFSVGSRWRSRVSPSCLVFRALPGWLLLVPGSLPGSVAAWVVRGGWLGRWLPRVPPLSGSRSGRVVFPRLASSFPCSRSVRAPRLGWGRGWGFCLLPWFLGGVLLFCCFFLTCAARAVPRSLRFFGFVGL